MIEVKNISKEYSDDSGSINIILKNISLSISPGKITSIVAPNNSGKSTLLKIISGLELATIGEVRKKDDQKIVLIPSKPSSFPWLNVEENISLGLLKKDSNKVKKIIENAGLEGYESFYPNNKSYGFRFRIALARSLAHEPEAILLDEPFDQMDIQAKKEILQLLLDTKNKMKETFLFATSNITEALYLSDKIYLMKKDPGEIFSEIDINFQKERT